jgi:uncharacterized NAD(P)/FAD-binding protein YdhS
MQNRRFPTGASIIIIGGGAAGSLFALKLARAQPDLKVILVERRRRLGRGLAYGACAPFHLLNVPVQRMEVGLEPRFTDWLASHKALIADAVSDSDGDLSSAFIPREFFGQYLQEQIEAHALSASPRELRVVRGDAVRLLDPPARGVLLEDGREIHGDGVVLATGNLPPRPPEASGAWLYDTAYFVSDPWARDAFDGLERDDPVLFLGTGLTTVDVLLKLANDGHRGPFLAVSRRGLLPQTHRAGGRWEPFLQAGAISPRHALSDVRAEIARADASGIPWQRVIDAVRPAVARLWNNWSLAERSQFLRHLRPRWDVVRHRMARRVSEKLNELIASGQLQVMAGRLQGCVPASRGVETIIRRRSGDEARFVAARVVNCTGPRGDLAKVGIPLIADLFRRGLITADPLALGIETRDCAAIGSSGTASEWLFAIGPLTRPAWWEITAVPEINAQIDRLVRELTTPKPAGDFHLPPLVDEFTDLGAGI